MNTLYKTYPKTKNSFFVRSALSLFCLSLRYIGQNQYCLYIKRYILKLIGMYLLIYRIVIIYLGIKINYPICLSNCIILLCLSTISLMFYSETMIFLVMLCGKQILVVCNVFHYTWQVTLYFSHNAIWVFAMVSKQSFSVFIIVLSRLFGYSKPN